MIDNKPPLLSLLLHIFSLPPTRLLMRFFSLKMSLEIINNGKCFVSSRRRTEREAGDPAQHGDLP